MEWLVVTEIVAIILIPVLVMIVSFRQSDRFTTHEQVRPTAGPDGAIVEQPYEEGAPVNEDRRAA